ncbi:hypothetical protein RM574_14690 [Streptomyces sp. DSM 41982]|uniref:Uncharacterized protein n=1 Tax=Streptomyces evansiae TaxID=3075535 RepID=A0ABD5E7H6_9ACTN|nr:MULTISPECIES: hypothetical protein [unclassified Streptomyces]MDT0416737.1 hypothetical protein [Streptomyces sp. DSM 41982]SCD56034.1 hypothetical protein GA0115246_103173 [Streptomyces sp. SolWspMP-sol7th]
MTTPSQENTVEDEDRVREAVTGLIAVFENLRAEHQALEAEEAKTGARERRGTVIRMGGDLDQSARTVALARRQAADPAGRARRSPSSASARGCSAAAIGVFSGCPMWCRWTACQGARLRP